MQDEAHLKDEYSRDHVNVTTLQNKTQNQAQKVESQKSKNEKNNPSKNRARKYVCKDIHEFEECSYIVSLVKAFNRTEDEKIRD